MEGFLLDALPFRVVQERAEAARVQVIQDENEVSLVKLERTWGLD